MFTERTGVGLDVHARSAAAAAIDTVTGEVIERRLGGDYGSVVDLARRLEAGHGPLRITYEAGPTGFGLARDLAAAGLTVQVAAPSRLLRPAGQRVKTDRTDAMLLARLTINDDIVAVRVPTMSQESARDLVRARDDARADLMRARHRLSKMMLRRGWVYPGRTTWGPAHDAWLRRIRANDVPALGSGAAAAFDDAYDAVAHALARRDRLDEAITALAADCEFTATTTRLSCLRPISTLTGFALAVEIGDWNRFTGATIASYLGLVPCEHSSGQTRSQGGHHQDRQHPRPPPADRVRLAAQARLPARPGPARGLGQGPRRRRRAGRQGQPAPAQALDDPGRPPQAPRRGQHRHRPRAGRLVLVTGDHGRAAPMSRARHAPQRDAA